MGGARGKRRIEQVDPAAGDDAQAPAQKATRAVEGPQAPEGQRFGETTEFLPLRQSSQGTGQQEDDEEQATDLVQGSQDMDDSVYATFILYGILCLYAVSQERTTLMYMIQVVCRLKLSECVIIKGMLPMGSVLL